MSLFRSCSAVLNCAFRLSPSLRIGTQALISIFFCPTIFLLTISAYTSNTRVELQPVTVALQKLHTTLLTQPRLLWTQTSEHPGKSLSSEWLLLRVQQHQGPLSKSLHHRTFLMIGISKLIFNCKISEWIKSWTYTCSNKTMSTVSWKAELKSIANCGKLGSNPRDSSVMLVFGFKERPRPFFSDQRPRRGRRILAPRDPSDPATLPTLKSACSESILCSSRFKL